MHNAEGLQCAFGGNVYLLEFRVRAACTCAATVKEPCSALGAFVCYEMWFVAEY